MSRGNKIGLAGAKLYLAKQWTQDKKRSEKAGIPKEERKYQTKPELESEIIKESEGVVEYYWIGGDSVYENSPELRKSLRELGKAYVTHVGEELQVCLEKPHSFLPQSSGRGHAKSRARQKLKDDCRKADPTVQLTAFWNVKNALEKLKINNLY